MSSSSSIPGAYTYLEYTIVPSPLVINEPQDIIILATLKTAVQNQGKLKSVAVDNIVLDFGQTGDYSVDLTTAANAITVSDFQKNPNWSFVAGGGTGMSFTATPSTTTSALITDNAVMIKISAVQVNDAAGNVTVTVTETVSEVNGKAATSGAVNDTSLVLPKVEADKDKKTSFKSTENFITAGQSTVLSWKGASAGAGYSLHYPMNGQLISVKNLPPSGQYPTDPTKNPLVLDQTTDFILEIQDSGSTSYKTTTVLVNQETIQASALQVGNSASSDEPLTTGHMRIADSGNNGVIYIPTGTGNSFHFRAGNDKHYKELAILDSLGNLNVQGNLSVGGSMSCTTELINGYATQSVGGWAGTQSVWETGDQASSDGASFGRYNGFSQTDGGGNYGYYEIAFNSPQAGFLMVDMRIACNAMNGQGFFNIMSASAPIGNNGSFPDDYTSSQIWATQQAPTWSAVWNGDNINVQSVMVRAYFSGQYIYIGARDLGQGSVAIAIDSVSAFAC